MMTGRSLEGSYAFCIERTKNGKWKINRYNLTWGEKYKTSFSISKMGYFEFPAKARDKKQRFLDQNNLIDTGEIRYFGNKKLQIYRTAPLIIL